MTLARSSSEKKGKADARDRIDKKADVVEKEDMMDKDTSDNKKVSGQAAFVRKNIFQQADNSGWSYRHFKLCDTCHHPRQQM